MAALVTGASGFVGSHLVARLISRGDGVRALVRRPDGALVAAGTECVIGDLRNADAVRQATRTIDTVYHIAAVTPGGNGDLWETNVEGTRTLLRACISSGVRRVVFLSSVAAYRPPLAAAIDEHSPTGGLELYGRSKAEAETIVRAIGGDQLEHVILRPCQIYGSGDRSGYTERLLSVLSGRYVLVGRGMPRFCLVHIDDVVDAIAAAGTQPAAAGGVFNIAGPGQTSLQQLAAVASVAQATSKRRIVIPRTALRGALLARRLLKAAGNRNVRPMLRSYAPSTLHGSMWLGGPDYLTTRAQAELEFVPRVSPGDGLGRAMTVLRD